MSYILTNGSECAHVGAPDMIATAERLANGSGKPIAIWEVFGVGAPRPIANPAGLALPDPIPALAPIASTEPAPAPPSAAAPAGVVTADYVPVESTQDGGAALDYLATTQADDVEPDAKTRIDAQQAALRAGGFSHVGHRGTGGTGEQFFENGTALAADGVRKQIARAREHAAKISAHDAAHEISAAVVSERRRDVQVTAGEISKLIHVNGAVTFDGYRLNRHAVGGILTRAGSSAAPYVNGLRDRIAAEMAKPAGERNGAILANDKREIAHVLAYECAHPAARDVKMTLRLREASGDCYAAVGPDYAPVDAPAVIHEILHALPSDAKGTWSYDPESTRWELRVSKFTPTPAHMHAVGEPFEGFGSIRSDDRGGSSAKGGGGCLMVRCTNATVYVARGVESRRRHTGNAIGDVGRILRAALASIDTVIAAWGVNRETAIALPKDDDDRLISIEEAIPGFWRSLLRDDRDLAEVLPGRKEEHVKALSRTYFSERRDDSQIVRADFGQAFTRYIQDFPADVRRPAEEAAGAWLVSGREVGYAAARGSR